MKGVILAGGSGSRLLPLTSSINKHLLPVGRKPMIFWPLEKMLSAGIKEIIIVTGVEHAGSIINCLGSGSSFGCSINYAVQDETGGIAQALGLTSNFLNTEDMCVILGDNMFEESLEDHIEAYKKSKKEAFVILKEVPDPERFGVANLVDGKIIGIEEKPQKPKSKYAVTGIYFYPPNVYAIIPTLKPSGRGELEISDVNNYYLKNRSLGYTIMDGFWSDAGTHESLMRASSMMSIIGGK